MKRRTGILLVASMALAAFLAPRNAQAVTIDTRTFNLAAFNVSGFTGPYVNVKIELNSATTATLTFTSLYNGTYSFLMLDGSAAAVNVNATSFTKAFVSATQVPGFGAPSPTSPPPPGAPWGSGQVDGWGKFNLTLNLNDGFGSPASKIVFTITNTSGSWGSSASNVLALNNAGHDAASHVGVCQGAISACTPYQSGLTGFVSTPEPGAVGVFSIGLLVAGGLIARLRKD